MVDDYIIEEFQNIIHQITAVKKITDSTPVLRYKDIYDCKAYSVKLFLFKIQTKSESIR